MVMIKRKQLRLKDYDYSSPGAYFMTICTHHREQLFGKISVGADPCVGPKMVMNGAGHLIDEYWQKIPRRFPRIRLDEYIVMPNHIHGIIEISGSGRTHGSAPTLFLLIQWFKTMTTNAYIRHVHNDHWPPFDRKLWQRNYFEHVVRNESDLARIREYIIHNPENWDKDENNINNALN